MGSVNVDIGLVITNLLDFLAGRLRYLSWCKGTPWPLPPVSGPCSAFGPCRECHTPPSSASTLAGSLSQAPSSLMQVLWLLASNTCLFNTTAQYIEHVLTFAFIDGLDKFLWRNEIKWRLRNNGLKAGTGTVFSDWLMMSTEQWYHRFMIINLGKSIPTFSASVV